MQVARQEKYNFDQQTIMAAQEYVRDLPPAAITYDHLFADGVYARIMHAPAGSIIVGLAHKTDHICILLKGSLSVTLDSGDVERMSAPAIWVAKAGQKKLGCVHEDLSFVNIHPTDTTDLEVIKGRVTFTDDEYMNLLAANRPTTTLEGVDKNV